jgi:MFS family permease
MFAALRYPGYRILWASMALGFLGMMMQGVARGWLAYDLTGAHTAVGVVMLAWGIPQLAFSLIGGAIADRMEKRAVMIATQLVIAATAFATGVAITSGAVSIPFLFVMGLMQGTVFAFNLPARQAMLPELVGRDDLMNAIALSNTAMNVSAIVAPAIAGALMATVDVAIVFYVQGLLNLVVVALITRLPASTSHLANERRGVLSEIKVGLSFIRRSRILRSLMLMAFVPSLLGMPYNVLLPGFATDDMRLNETGFGILMMAPGAGALVGSMAIAAWSGRIRIPLVQAIAGLVFGLSLAALAVLSSVLALPGALVALLVIGLSSTAYMTLNNTLLMQSTPPELYGRVMSVYMLTFSLFPLASWPMGIIADAITARATFSILGAAITGFIVFMALSNAKYVFGNPAGAEPRGASEVGATR